MIQISWPCLKKITKAEFKFPNWFSSGVHRLLSRILDPNPDTRISVAKIMENPWFKKGLDSKPLKNETKVKELFPLDADAAFNPSKTSDPLVALGELAKPSNLNAFHIISLSTGFDLSGLFVRNDQQEEVKFASLHPASAIISNIGDIARHLRFKVKKKDEGLLKLVGSENGRMGILSIDVHIFKLGPSFHLVAVKKSGGDILEYQMKLKQDMEPALKDLVWAWQDEKHLHSS